MARNGLEPVTDFTASATTGNIPMTVTFTDASAGSPTAWAWSFGDGGADAVQNPTHTYTVAGTYTVRLVATNAGGNDTKIKSNYITALPPAPVADFSATPVTGGYPLLVTFTDASLNTPTAWNWSFGDGGRSTAQNPSHTYTMVGSYTVSLTATNVGGSNTASKSDYISVTIQTSDLFPTDYSPLTAGQNLNNVHVADGQCLTIPCDPTTRQGSTYFHFQTPYSPSQVTAMHVDMIGHSTRDDTPNASIMLLDPITTSWHTLYDGPMDYC